MIVSKECIKKMFVKILSGTFPADDSLSAGDSLSADDSLPISGTLSANDSLSSDGSYYRLAAPASNGKKIDFLEVINVDVGDVDIDKIIMDDCIPYKSPKEFFFPRYEKLLSFCGEKVEACKPERPFIIFGAKPCDLKALDTMSKIFTEGKFKDPFFTSHLENNLLIGVSCQEKKEGCFCDRLSVDMNYSDKCDLFLESIEDDYRVLYVSDKGRDKFSPFIPELTYFENLSHPTTELPSEADSLETPKLPTTSCAQKPQLKPVSLQVHGQTVLNTDDICICNDQPLPLNETKLIDQINWEAIAETCQGCGLCTFICPTCHCFDFKDVEQNNISSRYRIWDSCMYPRFTLHASGHNPRESIAERFRQRVLHKFVYVPQNIGETACTGCGRCVRSCPAGMNIWQIVELIEPFLQQKSSAKRKEGSI